MKNLIIVILLLHSQTILADCSLTDFSACGVSLYLDGWSVHHVNNDNNYNEAQETKGLRIGVFNYIRFKNSFNNQGEAIFISAGLFKRKHIKAGLLFSLIYGYSGNGPQPALLPFLKIGYDPIWINTTCLYAADGTDQFICAFIFEIRIQ